MFLLLLHERFLITASISLSYLSNFANTFFPFSVMVTSTRRLSVLQIFFLASPFNNQPVNNTAGIAHFIQHTFPYL